MKRLAILFGLLTLALLCFIWGQSTLPREISASESGRLLAWLKPLLDPNDRISDEDFHHYLRKAAHFTEYAALGFCISGFLFNLPHKRERRWPFLAAAACVLAASVDETIQIFAADRGPMLTDVLLDGCGALFGLAVFLLLLKMLHARKKRTAG